MTARRDVAALPSGRGGLIRLRDARASGWSIDAVRHASDTGRVVRERPALYVLPPAQPLTEEAANLRSAQACAEGCERAVISHASGAIVHGLPTVCDVTTPCLTVPAGTPLRRLAKVHLHRATLAERDVVMRAGFPVTSPARTVLDLARERGVDAGVAAADQALRSGIATASDLQEVLDLCAGWPGGAAARMTAARADPQAESPLESLSRLRMADANLPMPRLQAQICTRSGEFVARCDFYWPQFGVVGEADGNAKYDAGRSAIVAERRREQALRDLGLIVVRWEWADLWHFDVVVRRLTSAFAQGTPPDARRAWRLLAR